MAYELMQTKHVDASERFTPIGMVYHNFPTRNEFDYDIAYAGRPENGAMVRHKLQIDGKVTKLDKRFHWSRITNSVPVDVFPDLD